LDKTNQGGTATLDTPTTGIEQAAADLNAIVDWQLVGQRSNGSERYRIGDLTFAGYEVANTDGTTEVTHTPGRRSAQMLFRLPAGVTLPPTARPRRAARRAAPSACPA
jgi:hypothetical protein